MSPALRMADDIDPEEALSIAAVESNVKEILSREHVQIRTENGVERSAREVLEGIDQDANAGKVIMDCMLRG